MTQKDKGKNIFQQAIDSVSNRDEKAALEAAMKQAEQLEQNNTALEQKAAQTAQKLADAELRANQTAQKLTAAESQATQLKADLSKAQNELSTTRVELVSARNRAVAAEGKLAAVNAELQKYVTAEQAKVIAAAAVVAEKSQIIAEHTLKADESLSHLSLKYYGSAYEPYWRVIYEANKELIGPNPGRVRPGMVIIIPVLPDELKKK